MAHAGKITLQLRDQFGIGAALKGLGQERAAGIEYIGRKRGRRFDEADDTELIGLAVAGGVGRHVGHHDVGAPAHHRDQFFGRVLGQKIELREIDAGDFRHLQQIDRNHLALAADRADALRRDLAPAAGGGAEIDHGDAMLEKAILVVDLDQLVGRARAIAVALGLRHIGIVELPLQPEF